MSIISRSVGHVAADGAAVGAMSASPAFVDRADEVLGRDVVLVDRRRATSLRVGDQEVVDVRRGPSPAASPPSSQNVWQRYMPRLPSPEKPSRSRMPQRGVDRVWAHAVRLSHLVELVAASELGAQLAVRQPVGVVGVDEQPADAVVELARRSAAPARRSTSPGSGTDIELCVAGSATSSSGRSHSSSCAVAAAGGGRRRGGAARADERTDGDHDDQPRRRPPRATRRSAPARRRRGSGRLRSGSGGR